MLTRIRKSMDEKEEGFTLIELLVVMIIIGILAAIAIPVFLNQRKKAQDTSAKSDVATIGKEIATWYVDNTTAPVVGIYGTAPNTRYALGVDAAASVLPANDIGKQGAGNVLGAAFYASAQSWCITVTNPNGDKAVTGFKYSAAGGLQAGACTAATG